MTTLKIVRGILLASFLFITQGCALTPHAWERLAGSKSELERLPGETNGQITAIHAVCAVSKGDAFTLYVEAHCDDGVTRYYESGADGILQPSHISILPVSTVPFCMDIDAKDRVTDAWWQRRQLGESFYTRPDLSSEELERVVVYWVKGKANDPHWKIWVSRPDLEGRRLRHAPSGPTLDPRTPDRVFVYELTGPQSVPPREVWTRKREATGVVTFFLVLPFTLALDLVMDPIGIIAFLFVGIPNMGSAH